MVRRWFSCPPGGRRPPAFLGAAAALLLFAALPALAGYRFQVLQNRSRVTINPDASLTVEYALTFANEGQPIDVVDVGLPSGDYDLSSVRADLDGRVPLSDIRPSEYVKDGVEVHLGGVEIRPGATGTLRLFATVRNRVFPDDADKTYASVVFSPTWYGADFTHGTTRLLCEFVFPEGVGPEETRYHRDSPFTSARVENGRVVFVWEIPEASPSAQYTFGASFPARVMARLAEKPKGPGPLALLFRGIVRLLGSLFPCLFVLVFFGLSAWGVVQSHRRRLQYLPPTVGMEGVEVRRGLTVPEVAVLQEQPVNRVLSLLLFGMIRKKLLEVTSRKPLRFRAVEGAKPDFSYEAEFLKAVKDDGKLDEGEAARVLTDLVKKVAEKMKGYSRKKTLAYYRTIMDEAWKRVGTEDYSQAFEWMLLDKDFERTATERWGQRPLPLPGWWGPFHGPTPVRTSGGGSGGGASGGDLSGALSDLSAGAHGIVSGLEGFANDLVGSVPGLASKVTAKTNPVPVSSGGGHSGGGCACACACAGCACACAGGGR